MPQIADENALRMAELINEARAAEGTDPLEVEIHLNASARVQSEHMDAIDKLTHDGPDGNSLRDRVEGAEFDLSGQWRLSENVGFLQGYGKLSDADLVTMHNAFVNSPGHYQNLMDPNVHYIGVHVHEGDMVNDAGVTTPTVFFTMNFAATAGETIVQDPVSGVLTLSLGGEVIDVLDPDDIDGLDQGEAIEPAAAQAGSESPEQTDADPQRTTLEDDPPFAEENEEEDEDQDAALAGGGCFVATAAYGDRLHPDVMALRRYRDLVMSRSAFGRVLIRAYWIIGPQLARIVRPRGRSGQACRALLGPLSRRLDPRVVIVLGPAPATGNSGRREPALRGR